MGCLAGVVMILASTAVLQELESAIAALRTPVAEARWLEEYSVKVENDSIPGANKDQAYTQGLEFRFNRSHPWSLLDALLTGTLSSDSPKQSFKAVGSLSIGQTIFTPVNLLTYYPSRLDRPFTAHLYATFESALVRTSAEPFATIGTLAARIECENRRALQLTVTCEELPRLKPERHSLSVTVGLTGASGGRDIQSGFHVLRENRLVKGWLVPGTQNPNLHVNVRWTRDRIVVQKRQAFDVTTSLEAAGGTVQTTAGAGITVRAGHGLSGLPAGLIHPSIVTRDSTEPQRRNLEIAIRLSGRARGVAHNLFVQGPLWDLNDQRINRRVVEGIAGLDFRWKAWKMSYSVVWRSKEFEPLHPDVPRSQRFVAIDISREAWDDARGPDPAVGHLLGGTRVSLLFGRSVASVEPRWTLAHRPPLAAALGMTRALAINRKGLRRIFLGFETIGTGLESRPTPTSHTDLFLLAKAFTVGREFLPDAGRHRLHLRVGGGRALTKRTAIHNDTGDVEEPLPERRSYRSWSAVAGGRYSFELISRMSLVADLAVFKLAKPTDLVERAHFLSLTAGFELHPWGHRPGGIK